MKRLEEQYQRMHEGRGFIAALDQSGGSTPKALQGYGIARDAYDSEEEMFDLVHAMRTRIIANPVFNEDHILGAILFIETLRRKVEDVPTATYLWERKGIVPFLKIDQGMREEDSGVQLMKEIEGLDDILAEAREAGVFGTKMRSVIREPDVVGIGSIAGQQFRLARQICEAGLVPIIEPEVDIHSRQKVECEVLLRENLLRQLDQLPRDHRVMLKLTLPEKPDFHRPCIEHPRVVRVVALSGGYDREEANERLAHNRGLVASFLRALLEGLTAQQSDEDFTSTLQHSIQSIYEASLAPVD